MHALNHVGAPFVDGVACSQCRVVAFDGEIHVVDFDEAARGGVAVEGVSGV